MKYAKVTVDAASVLAAVSPRLFGTFVEHMGRCVYGGIYEPDHPSANLEGFREDVLALVRELGVTAVRYPGGNFVSGYAWEDGIGPKELRPTRLDRAWKTIETNQVGTDEFLRWANEAGCEPIMAVNLGTRGVQEACDLLEYTNRPGGTYWADQRIKNGQHDPYRIRTWCLGNELDGPWQLGHKTAFEYGRIAAETARAMRRTDPDIELVACGSSNAAMPTFGAWESTVLEHTYDLVDHVSLHGYYEQHGDDQASFLASAVEMDHMIDSVVATADAVGARLRSKRKLTLSFDEWNVWYQRRFGGEESLSYEGPRELIEDDYSVRDAVVVGGLLISLLRHGDRVAIACLAQLVNVIAPIRTEIGGTLWRQTTFHPFALTARYAGGETLAVSIESPSHHTERHGDVATVDCIATRDDDGLTVIMTNRSPHQAIRSVLDLHGASPVTGRQWLIADTDHGAGNSAVEPRRVEPREGELTPGPEGTFDVVLPACSWALVRFETSRLSRTESFR